MNLTHCKHRSLVTCEPIQPLKGHARASSSNGRELGFGERPPATSDAQVLNIINRVDTRSNVVSEFWEAVFNALNAAGESRIIIIQRIESWVSCPIDDPLLEMAMSRGEARPVSSKNK